MEHLEYRLPPRTLLLSFLLVGGGYISSAILLYLLGFGLGLLLSPETLEAFASEPTVFQQQLETNAAEILPQKWYWPLLGLQSVACLGIGYTVTRMAPFAKFAHCVFLAMILCVSFLQSAVAAPAPIQWMHIGLMAATPIATLLGGKIYLSTVETVSPENADH